VVGAAGEAAEVHAALKKALQAMHEPLPPTVKPAA